MFGLRNGQKAQLGSIISGFNLDPLDFEWNKTPKTALNSSNSPKELVHKKTGHFFRFENRKPGTNTPILISYTPRDDSPRMIMVPAKGWNELISNFEKWVSLVKEEIEAIDPWAETEGSSTFADDVDSPFTEEELIAVDSAVEKSMEELIRLANQSGLNKTLDEIKSDIKYLKDQARIKPRKQWLELFKSVIASKLLDWGINAIAATQILQVLYDAAEPTLKLVAIN